MKKIMIILVLLMLSIIACAENGATSSYTSTNLDNCKAPEGIFRKFYDYSEPIKDGEPVIPEAVECSGKSGYKIFVAWDSSITWVDISNESQIWSTRNNMTSAGTNIMSFPSIEEGKMEWRYTKSGNLKGIIFRIGGMDVGNPNKLVSRLLVVNLENKIPKYCGVAKTNEEARALLDSNKCTQTLEKIK